MATVVEIDPPRIIDWNQTDLYRFFAFAFGAPTAERHRWFSQEGVPEALAELWRQLSCEGPFPGFEWFPDFETYEAAYIAVFDVGAPEPPVPLFESAHDKSRAAQELVLENTCFYEVLGLRVNPTASTPDHLLTQLEFLSAVTFAQEQASTESRTTNFSRLEREFLERHLLNWTGAACNKLQECSILGFPVLFRLLNRLLGWRWEMLAPERPRRQPSKKVKRLSEVPREVESLY
jgi:DMSO reductase family type II enzyme chaperone